MKARNLLIVLTGLLVMPLYFGGCAVDRWEAYAGQTRTDRWIDDTMRVWYYWKQDIPHTNDLNYFSPPFEFFASVLSEQDGKDGQPFSTIDSLDAPATRGVPSTDYGYGFQYTTNHVEDNDTALYARLLYVSPDSPAGEAGLERGDWILEMDGEPITENNYSRLNGGEGITLTVGYYDAAQDTILAYAEPQTLAPARTFYDNPVHYRNVYVSGSKRVGYLVYNHFTGGLTESSTEYDDDLREAFNYFATEQVNEFVLDLRYNNGGQLSCASLLCAMLAPSSALGQTLAYLEFNESIGEQEMVFDESLIQGGANLNLSRLYVLTSTETASASEMLINCLKPYMEVVLVGGTTVGKNVASRAFVNEELMLEMRPIVCKLYNADRESEYAEGFTADVSVDENGDMARFLPFGNPDELMLYTALNLINGTQSGTQQAAAQTVTVKYNSVARKASQAVEM
ncbi:MAG: peptidase S41 [Candidatus Bacteroides intestinipullorum]|uniref:Peptidase S41 n=1 Tax=Candidatus Bacteroides intestinipullorum TaxID=2838471 RepID=A0A9E2NN42_9BACE|nr:peptidase S41 [Candidatus Bacteroides intestinipullorum]